MEASQLKAKLNGSILKGHKIKIEPANAKAEAAPEEPEEEKVKRAKHKRKRDEIPGAEIGERSVKRGWTTPGAGKKGKEGKGEKKREKSKYTGGKECLFKTVVPPNRAVEAEGKKGKTKSKETVVHEFEKTIKHASFLRGPKGDGKKKVVAEFVEGKGWVDEDGNVVEEVITRPRKVENTVTKSKKVVQLEAPPAIVEKDVSEESSSDSSEDDETPGKVDSITQKHKANSATPSSGSPESDSESEGEPEQDSQSASTSSGSDSDSESDSSSASSNEQSILASPIRLTSNVSTPLKTGFSRPASSSGLTISIPNSAVTSTPISNPAGTVHPLEALYKRAKSNPSNTDPKAQSSSFSFFGADNDDLEDEELAAEAQDKGGVPLTPFTQRDFEYRGLRSAAPTPDTAHGNKRFLWPGKSASPPSEHSDNSDDDEDDKEGSSSPVRKFKARMVKDGKEKVDKGAESEGKGEKGGAEESEFQKWFYENRGSSTRAWKARRKAAAKEKRQRENRRGGSRS